MKFLKKIIIYFFTFLLICKNIFEFVNGYILVFKQNIILFNKGGFGHYVQDVAYLNYHYKNKKKIIFYFLNHNNNKLLKNCVKNIQLINFEIFLNIPYYKKRLFIYDSALIFEKLIINIINLSFKKKILIKNYQELDNLFIKNKKISKELSTKLTPNIYKKRDYIGAFFAHQIELKDFNKNLDFKLKLKNKTLKKINNFDFNNKKFIFFYYRKKTQIDGKRLKEVRDGGDISNYEKGFEFLINQKYTILMNGDTDYLIKNKLYISLKKKFYNNIIFSRDLKINNDELFIYSIFNSNLFIGNAGGGSFFHPYVSIPGLILDCYPYWATVKNSLIYYKPLIDKNGKDIRINNNILSDYHVNSDDNKIYLRDMNENEIYNSIKNFYDLYNNKKYIIKNNFQNLFHQKLPEWYFIRNDKNSMISDQFIKDHWE